MIDHNVDSSFNWKERIWDKPWYPLWTRSTFLHILKTPIINLQFEEFRHVNAYAITITIKIQNISITQKVLLGSFAVILFHPNNQYCSVPCDYTLDLTYLEFQIQYVLCVWHFLLSIILLWTIHVEIYPCYCACQQYVPFYCGVLFCCVNIPQFVAFHIVDGHLGCWWISWVWSVMNKAAMYTSMCYKLVCGYVFTSLGLTTWGWICWVLW